MVANTTYGFVAASVAAVLLAAPFALTGHPFVALGAMVVPYGAFFIFLFATWHHAPKHPDISVIGDGDYVAALTQRMAAKNQSIVPDQSSVIAGTLTRAQRGQRDA